MLTVGVLPQGVDSYGKPVTNPRKNRAFNWAIGYMKMEPNHALDCIHKMIVKIEAKDILGTEDVAMKYVDKKGYWMLLALLMSGDE